RADGRAHVASPAARRIAEGRGIDLSQVKGSGPGGRIIVRDLDQVAAAPAGGLRDAVIANITASWQQIPHIHIGGELIADGLAEAKRAAPQGSTVTDLLVLAVARALRDVPALNGGERIHLSLAVATEGGVVAPVL